ncbi:MAG TPA: DUF3606 domain-containing protein [Flavobacteriales bacterium]|nr:DUF3606 domain-containing protein [Flavobacteriales bacterium]
MEKDDAQKPTHQKRVDISSEESLIYWAKHFNCNRTDLVRAVIQVGSSYAAVDAFLEMNRKKRQ